MKKKSSKSRVPADQDKEFKKGIGNCKSCFKTMDKLKELSSGQKSKGEGGKS